MAELKRRDSCRVAFKNPEVLTAVSVYIIEKIGLDN